MRKPDAGNGLQPELLGSFNTPMTGDDQVIIIDQDRIVESEALDALRDLLDLLRRMGSCIA
jgi:hypothetical protein